MATATDYHRLVERKRQSAMAVALLDVDLAEEAPPIVEPTPPSKAPHLTIPVRRMAPTDLQDTAPWLLPRLRKIWTSVSDATWASKIRYWMMMNTASFVRTDNVVGLAFSIQDDIDLRVRVYERFVLAREQSTRLPGDELHPIDAEILSVYRTMRQWARLINAVRFEVLNRSDLRNDLITKYFNWNLVRHQTTYMRLSE